MTKLPHGSPARGEVGELLPPCPVCARAAPLRRLADRLDRCAACAAVIARPRPATGCPPLELGELARIAPQGVLRERYQLLECIGRGAHGVSYFAEHRFLNHPCVVKVLPYRALGGADAAVQRLRHEARAGFRVNHPNVVRVLDCDVVDGVWYFAMEYVDGVNLADVLADALSVPWRQAVDFALDAASGLAAIHRAGVMHRDLKPGNLILGADGRVRVADLGIATFGERDPAAWSDGRHEMVGTFDYAAPEMFAPQEAKDGRADLYSLGATLFHLLTGRIPHAAPSFFQTLLDSQRVPPPWPADVARDAPQWLIDAVLRLLEPEPEDRFASPDALIEHLRQPLAAPLRSPAAPPLERLQPRGVAVLPFRNEGGTEADDWLGAALAEYLTRGLAQSPTLYVVDAPALLRILEQPTFAEEARHDRLLAAGRLVGAATVVEGQFRREGETLRVGAEIYRAGAPAQTIGPSAGPLARLMERQEFLLSELVRALGAEPSAASGAPPVPLAAQEKCTLAKQAYLRGDYEAAIELADAALRLAPDFAEPIQYLGVCLARLGRYAEAAEQHRRQEALARQRGDRRLVVEAQANLGVMHYFRGEYEAAQTLYASAATTGESLGLTAELANIYNNLGFVLFRLKRPSDAEQAFQRAIELHRSYGALASLVAPYNGMGNVLVEQGRFPEATSHYRRALTLAEEIGDRTNVGMSCVHLGRCASLQGRFADAKHDFALALNALEETSFWNGLAVAYEHIATMHLQLGDVQEAERCADKRIELARLHANRRIEAAAWQQKAQALRQAGRQFEADECLRQATDAGRLA